MAEGLEEAWCQGQCAQGDGGVSTGTSCLVANLCTFKLLSIAVSERETERERERESERVLATGERCLGRERHG